MKNKQYKLLTGIFFGILVVMACLFLLMPKEQYSASERRRLAKLPPLTLEGVLDKSYMESLEEYLLDHFPFREQLRRIKAYYAYDVLRQKENNEIYVADGYACKLEYPLRPSEIRKAADKMLALQQQYFPQARTYYAVIPDKNYYLAESNGYPAMDYEELQDILHEKLTSMSQIPLEDTLTIQDYYHTDTHWRQECLGEVMNRLGESLGFSMDMNKLQWQTISSFYGVYYGQSALPLTPDTMQYGTDEVTQNVSVWNLETGRTEGLYHQRIAGQSGAQDLYDLYLGGAAAVQVITSPEAATDKKLIIFRDSFTSSLAPLLSEVYHEIILIDTRYIASSLLGEYVDFADADVLFLYNTTLLNHASMLK